MKQLIQFEYRRPGKGTVVYEELLALDRPDVKVLMQDYTGPEVVVRGSVILRHGSPIVWFIFDGAWHDIGSFHLENGTLSGWYTNLSRPVVFAQDKWIGNDLFLDLWQPVQGQPIWLDEDEFHAAIKAGLIDQATRKRVLNERALIDLQIRRGEWPPAIVRDIDIQQARALLHT